MPNPTIASNHALSKTKFANEILEGSLINNPLMPIMRPNGSNSIIITEKFNIGEGSSSQVAFTDEIGMDGWKTGDERLSGTGEGLSFVVDNVSVARDRVAVQVNNITESALRTGVNLPDTAKRRLQRAAASRVAYKLLAALTDESSGRTRNRYLYGASDDNWNATHATALANVDVTDDKMSLAMLDEAKFKAENESSSKTFMTPASFQVTKDAFVRKWVVLLTPIAGRDIKRDPDFKNLVNYKDKPVFNVINGGTFIGEYNDMLIYVVPTFYKPTTANPNPMYEAAAGANSIDVSHCLLLGANAACLAYGAVKLNDDASLNAMYTTVDTDGSVRMAITTEVGDHGGNAEMAVTMVPGYKKLVDSISGTAEDVGVVHIFCSGKK
jgi:N4-gp56 family major capsid protein